MKNFFKKIFDKHHAIERFGISFLILTIVFCAITGSIISTSYKKNHQALADTAIYTTEFTMSRTQTKGTVEGIFTNKDNTKALILLHFENMSNMSVDANNYTIFLRGINNNKMEIEPLESNPTGALYIFGSSGYMGLYVVDKQGLQSQIWYMTLRNDKELTNVNEENVQISEDSGQTEQYAKYDLADIYFNPAAKNATVVSCLDNDVVTVRDMYEECITRPQEAELRAELDANLKDMRADLATILEYEQRLDSYGIAINNPYPCIMGDYITNANGEIVATMDMAAATVNYKEDDVLTLHTTSTLAGGANFDWRNGDLFTGYLTSLAGASTVESYIENLQFPSYTDDKQINDTWYYKSSGKEFSIKSASGFTETNKDINMAIQGLESSWDSYYLHKKTYQTDTLVKLLELDYQIMNAESNYTVNNKSDLLRITKK
jgi:hypothetical protein